MVTAGAKTGTSELGGNQTENGVFVCFAPYDDPEIAVAIVIEHATWGSNLATTGVDILNAYFTADETGSAVTGETNFFRKETHPMSEPFVFDPRCDLCKEPLAPSCGTAVTFTARPWPRRAFSPSALVLSR